MPENHQHCKIQRQDFSSSFAELLLHTYITMYSGSDIFHDQPPVDDYDNYRRNVIMGRFRTGG